MAGPAHAVFLSYASQDAAAARRICEALREGGVEVFLDQSELRGGDAWDQKIRHEIHDCALFIPVISRHTQERLEGYFRHEWRLAIERTHHMAEQKPFLVPVVVDGTRDQEALVPEGFRAVQWTHLPQGETPAAFVGRIKGLLSPQPASPSALPASAPGLNKPGRAGGRSAAVLLALCAVVLLAVVAYRVSDRFGLSGHPGAPAGERAARAAQAPAAAFNPPPHSIAVLPFVNMSGDREQEYFSDGLTEELLDALTRIRELHVAARTSVFSFKGKDSDIDTIARRLNVAAVLEGSVRRSAHTVRISAQLVDAATGFHVWSQTYDRNLGDVLALETDIATSVAGALKVRLLADTGSKIELGGTSVAAAFDAYLRGKKTGRTALSGAQTRAAIGAYTQALQLDPRFAMAFAERSLELANYADFNAQGAQIRASFDQALADARAAVALAPELAEAHYALAVALKTGALEFGAADAEYERALALAPGSARILGAYSRNAAELGHTSAAIAAARRAVVLDPLNFHVHRTVGIVYLLTRQPAEAIAALRTSISLQPDYVRNFALLGEAQYQQGDAEAARASCEVARDIDTGQICLAIVYHKLGRQADAAAMLAKLRSSGAGDAYTLACIYARWGDAPQALQWLETALRERDSGLSELKAEPDLDPLRKEPRFQAIERALKFPD